MWVMSVFLIVALVFQFRLQRYVPIVYWLTVVLISIVGTLITDNLVDNEGVSLPTSTTIWAIARLHLRGLVLARTDALDPHDLYDQARGVLLGGDPLHLRARYCRRDHATEDQRRVPVADVQLLRGGRRRQYRARR